MKLEDFKIGDIIITTTRMRPGLERRCAQVTDLNYNNLGLVQISPCKHEGLLDSGYSSFDPADVGSKHFGKQSIEFVGHRKIRGPGSSWQPQPGNPSYDLMC